MGLIIGKSGIPMFKVGYPTVSDKYNITGGILAGNTAVKFGDLVKFSSTKGYYEAITSTVTLANIPGFVLATNVKLATEWPGTDESVKVLPGEAFNLVLPGSYLAIEGITSPDGRCLGKMAHSERRGESVAINIYGEQDMKIFESGVKYFRD